MAHIEFLDETLRDGQQSLWGMRMQAGMALPIAPILDKTGFCTIDLTGSSMFEVMIRHCREDPWEGFNRGVFAFNEFADRYVLNPVAKGYNFVLPSVARKGVTNFFSNITLVRSVVNSVLQLRLVDAAKGTGGFLLNSTVGLLGFVDVATKIGLT